MTANRRLCAATLALITASPLPLLAQDTGDAVPITVSAVRKETLTPAFGTSGTVHSRSTAVITAGLDGQLAWVAEPGTFVAAGEPVARFDCEALQLRREELATLVEREAVRQRSLTAEVERMERAGLATSLNQLERVRADRDLARVEVRIGEVRVRQTENQLTRCTAAAPFSGVVTAQTHRGGEDVSRAQPLATITDISRLEVRASIPIRFLQRVAAGTPVPVTHRDLRLVGSVRTLVPAAESASQTFELRIDLPAEAAAQLATGQLVGLELPIAADPAITVPRDAIVLRSEGAFVMRIDADNRVERIAVALDEASGERVAVVGTLRAGDRVAVRGAEALEDGASVTVLPDGPVSPAG